MNCRADDLRMAGTPARPGADAERGRLQGQLRGRLGTAGAAAAVAGLRGPGGRGGRVLLPPSAQPASPLAGRAVRDSCRRALPGAALAGRADSHAHDPKPQTPRPLAAVRRHRQHEHRRRPAARRPRGYRQGRRHRRRSGRPWYTVPEPDRSRQAESPGNADSPREPDAGATADQRPSRIEYLRALVAEEGPEPAGTAGQAVPLAGIPLRVDTERPLARTGPRPRADRRQARRRATCRPTAR